MNNISDEKLTSIKPLIDMLYQDYIYIEAVDFDDLDEDEKKAVIKAEQEDKDGELTDFEDYLKERGIEID